MLLLSSRQAATLADVPIGSISGFLAKNILRPVVRSTSNAESNYYSFGQCLALSILYAARRSGATLEASVYAYDMLHKMTEQELQAAYAEHRHFLCLIGTACSRRLVIEQAAYNQNNFKTAIANRSNITIVNVRDQHEKILAAIESGLIGDVINDEPAAAPQTSAAEPERPEADRCPA